MKITGIAILGVGVFGVCFGSYIIGYDDGLYRAADVATRLDRKLCDEMCPNGTMFENKLLVWKINACEGDWTRVTTSKHR